MSVWLELFDRWSATPPDGVLPRGLVHKHRDENVFLARLAEDGRGVADAFAAEFAFDTGHPYFFEHPCDHVPGMALIEAARQMGIGIAHQHYGVPLDGYAFFVHRLETAFQRLATLEAPVFGRCDVDGLRFKKGRLTRLTCHGQWAQKGERVGTILGEFSIVSTAVLARAARS